MIAAGGGRAAVQMVVFAAVLGVAVGGAAALGPGGGDTPDAVGVHDAPPGAQTAVAPANVSVDRPTTTVVGPTATESVVDFNRLGE
jgi:hypothetical protein